MQAVCTVGALAQPRTPVIWPWRNRAVTSIFAGDRLAAELDHARRLAAAFHPRRGSGEHGTCSGRMTGTRKPRGRWRPH